MSKVPTEDKDLDEMEMEGLVSMEIEGGISDSKFGTKKRKGFGSAAAAKARFLDKLHNNHDNSSARRKVFILLCLLFGICILFVARLSSVSTDSTVSGVDNDHSAAVEKESFDGDGDAAIDSDNSEASDGDGDGDDNSDNDDDDKVDDSMTPEEKIIAKWGKWHFWDSEEEMRPKDDFLAAYPNRDVPDDEFPESAWQGDAVYVNHFLDSGSELITRAKEAIYAEYGWKERAKLTPQELLDRKKMFQVDHIDLENEDVEPADSMSAGGWTTKRSFDALCKRLLHAMMTNDSFTIVLGGDSSAAGHGNHFAQSYMMQFNKIMMPIFERLGMKLVVRNMARDGFGTMQSALGSGSIYGDEVDIIVWDSSLTEETEERVDLFYRQALIGGNRPPMLWGGSFDVLKELYLESDAEVIAYGSAMMEIPETFDDEQAESMPWAMRYLKCGKDNDQLCTSETNKFRNTCWVDRDDLTPPKAQKLHVPTINSLNPGFRVHQLRGRAMAFHILDALSDALATWSDATIGAGFPLSSEYWHITDHYDNIRSKALSRAGGFCTDTLISDRVCTTPMKGKTQYTPRANPDETSIVSILKPTPDGYIPKNQEEMLYDGPDVPNPSLMIPEGEIDVLQIVSNRRRLSNEVHNVPVTTMMKASNPQKVQHDITSVALRNNRRRQTKENEIVPGNGWEVLNEPPGHCDGAANSICGRNLNSDCLLAGHMDGNGGIIGNALSGWLVMNVPNVTQGLIIVNIDTWHQKSESKRTEGWTEENDGKYTRRELNGGDPELPENFVFEFAIDQKITSWTRDEFLANRKFTQQDVELLELFNDPEMATSGVSNDIEVALRLRNCDRDCVLMLTHIYWA